MSTIMVEEKYKQYPERIAQVFLEINYGTKTFTIRPGGHKDFVFQGGSEESSSMWQVIGRCIIEAARIADEELWHPAPTAK